MKKNYLILVFSFLSQMIIAQDVIIKRDGSSIISKVLEVNTDDVKYKKFSNLNGPTYTIKKSDLFSINYENGEKDMFDSERSSSNNNLRGNGPLAYEENPRLEQENLALVREFNSHEPIYKRSDVKKDWEALIFMYGIKEGSILETPELSASYSFQRLDSDKRIISLSSTAMSSKFVFVVSLKNKTKNTIFIDQGTSFVIFNGNATPYYVPTATSSTYGTSSGVSVNMGAVTGALGIGGIVGSLANGVDVGEGSSSSSTQITYSQRVISIPPGASIMLPAQELLRKEMIKPYIPYFLQQNVMKEKKSYYGFFLKDFKCGQKINIPLMNNLNPMGVHITYSLDENIRSTRTLHADFFLRQIMGTRISGYSHLYKESVDFGSCSLCFFTCSPDIGVGRASDLDISKQFME